ncbi:hypothetical protein GCM10023335_72740 [Streptomyces siamensis]|uniref:Uncharacterized protein n=1 Tax=Streptomyces siamensis TaxID=1274986 RepID=A0ABP9JI81_9ACTN
MRRRLRAAGVPVTAVWCGATVHGVAVPDALSSTGAARRAMALEEAAPVRSRRRVAASQGGGGECAFHGVGRSGDRVMASGDRGLGLRGPWGRRRRHRAARA